MSKAEIKCTSISHYFKSREATGKRARESAFMASQFIATRGFEVVGTRLCGWAEAEHQLIYGWTS